MEEVEEGYGSFMLEERLPHHSWDWRAQSEVLARLGTQITSLSASPAGETSVSQVWLVVSIVSPVLPVFPSSPLHSQGLSVSAPGITPPPPPSLLVLTLSHRKLPWSHTSCDIYTKLALNHHRYL